MTRRLLLMTLLACTLIAALPGAARVHAQGVTGAILGTVTDPEGSRLPGVTVTVTGPQLIKGQEVTTSSDQGTYRVPNLPPGVYAVSFEIQGFQPVRREGITLLSGQSLAVDVRFQVATLQETLIVTADAPLVDTRNSALVNIAEEQTLKNVPVERQYTKFLNIMPGVVDTKYDFTQGNNVHGSSSRQNKYAMDGMGTDDPWNVTSSTDLAVDSIQEVQITTAGISAEYGDASGGVFNFVTKSGSNDFHGGVNLFYQDDNTRSSNVTDELRNQGLTRGVGVDKNRDSSALLGGPIMRNRFWFFGNYRRVEYDESKPDFRSALTNRDHQVFTKQTVQVTPSNKAEVSIHYRKYRNFPYTATASFRNSEDSRTWMAVEKQQWYINPTWTAVLGPTTTLEARGSFGVFELLATNPNNDGSPAYRDLATSVVSGGDFHAAGDNRRNRHQAKIDLSHFLSERGAGNHTFKGGFMYQVTPMWGERFYQGARGPNELAGCTDGCVSDTPDTAHLLFNGAPFQVELYNGPVTTRLEMQKWHAYVQDQWVVRNRLTLNLGIRADHATGNLPETTIGGGRWDPLETVAEQNGVLEITNFSPRFGAVWDVQGDHKTTVKASAGRFYDQLAGSDIDSISPARLGFRLYDWSDRNGDRVYQPGEETLLRADTRPNPARLPRIDPELKNQYSNVFTLGIERQLATNWALQVTGIFKRESDFKGLVNEAVPFSAYNRVTVTNPLNGQPLEVFTLRPEFLGVPPTLVLTNPGERPGDTVPLRRKYDGLEFVVRRQYGDGWLLQGSYVFGNGQGNVPNNFGGSALVNYTDPNRLVNRDGDLLIGPHHQVKLYGAFEAPLGILLSGYFEALTGNPWTDDFGGFGVNQLGAPVVRILRTENPQLLTEPFIDVTGEPVGSRKMDTQYRVDFRGEKKFDVGTHHLSVIADVFNLLNANTVIRLRDLRFGSPNFGLPAELQLPRQIRFGLRWDF